MSETISPANNSKLVTRSRPSELDTTGFPVTPRVFGKFQQLIHAETGIWLGESKVALLCGRLSRRMRALGVADLDRYYELVSDPSQHEERILMIDAITTNETRFFRDPRQFEFLERRAIPHWRSEAQQGRRAKNIRLWSAGCSSGEEPYSLAMLVARHLQPEHGWNVTILATDISTRVLERARAGIYGIEKAVDIPQPLLKDHMLKGIAAQTGHMKVVPEVQSTVSFQRLNLMQDPLPGVQCFDAIFCRNVLIYFDLASKLKVIERLVTCLHPRGLLFLGQAENLGGISSQWRSLAPSVYARTGVDSGF